jgi:hypothetical protein
MIVWEHQNGESNGGYNRLTIWRDGRSEVDMAPLKRRPRVLVNLARAVYPSLSGKDKELALPQGEQGISTVGNAMPNPCGEFVRHSTTMSSPRGRNAPSSQFRWQLRH